MNQPADQEDATAERGSEHGASSGRAGLMETHARDRSQAALVRESLVRCPGGSELGPQ